MKTTWIPLARACAAMGFRAFAFDGLMMIAFDARGDEGADVGDLARRVGLAMGDPEPVDLAALQRLRLDRADHPLAPPVADEGVRDTQRELVLRAARLADRCGGRDDQAEYGKQNAEARGASTT